MELNQLTAISPVDGRYRSKCAALDEYFSEFGLIRYRVKVEIEYFIALAELPLPALAGIDAETRDSLRDIYRHFSIDDAKQIKDIESVTNHDVKAVEYFLKNCFDARGLADYKEYIHFGLTSQDINNTAVPMSIADAIAHVYRPAVVALRDRLAALAAEFAGDFHGVERGELLGEAVHVHLDFLA